MVTNNRSPDDIKIIIEFIRLSKLRMEKYNETEDEAYDWLTSKTSEIFAQSGKITLLPHEYLPLIESQI